MCDGDDRGKNQPPSGVSWRSEEEPAFGIVPPPPTSDLAYPDRPTAAGTDADPHTQQQGFPLRSVGMPMEDFVSVMKFIRWLAKRGGEIRIPGSIHATNLDAEYMSIVKPLIDDINAGKVDW